MKTKEKLSKFLACVMAMAIVIGIMPMQVMAATAIDNAADLQAAIDSATGPTTIVIGAIDTNATINIPGGSNITLTGGSLTAVGGGNFAAITVSSGATLTIDGITITRTGGGFGSGVAVSGGSLYMSGGNISGHAATFGGGVDVYRGNFTMSGGIISGNEADDGGGVAVYGGNFTMSGGEINNNTAYYEGGGVAVTDGNFTMSGGTISDNEALAGGGVAVVVATFTMSGGTISDNEAIGGGGVFVGDGTFTMSGGTISGNEATAGGGGVFVIQGTFNMSGGTISGNETIANPGGGVAVVEGIFNMSGGNISGNTALAGGGVFVLDSTFTMTDGEINNNTAYEGGGVAIDGFPSTFTMYGGTIENNTATSGIYADIANDGGTIDMRGGTLTASDEATLRAQVALGGTQTINVTTPIPLTIEPLLIPAGANITFTGGGSLTAGGYFNAITVETGATLTIDGITITRTIGTGSGVAVEGGNLYMSGGEISGHTTHASGGGVDIFGGTFTMSGGTIRDNTVGVRGGGVFLYEGTFTMSGTAVIRDNTAGLMGGGVAVAKGTFNMSGGTIIDNTADVAGGGVATGYKFTMTGGAILHNNAPSSHNVYVPHDGLDFLGEFTMSGGVLGGGAEAIGGDGTAPSAPGQNAVFWDETATTFTEGTSTGLTSVGNDAVWERQGSLYGVTMGGQFIHIPGVTVTPATPPAPAIPTPLPPASHRIIYNPNGGAGSVITDTVARRGSHTVRSADTFTRNMYTLVGWNTRADGSGTMHEPGAVINNVTGDIRLYAQWAQLTIIITIGEASAEAIIIVPREEEQTKTVALPEWTNQEEYWAIEAAGIIYLTIPHALLLSREDEDIVIVLTAHEADFVSMNITVTVGGEEADETAVPFTVAKSLANFDLTGLNTYRIVARFRNPALIGGIYNRETGLMTFRAQGAGELSIDYVETLNRLTMGLDSPIIYDLAGNAPTQFMDVLPLAQNGRALIPIRFVAQALGAEVSWLRSTEYRPQIAILTIGGVSLVLPIGELTPELEALGMDVPPRSISARTMVPLRFVSEFFGAVVSWDRENRTIEIIRDSAVPDTMSLS